jgi:hypothetical protein
MLMISIILEREASNADLVKLGDHKLPGYRDYTIARIQQMLGLKQMSGYNITGDVLSPLVHAENAPHSLPDFLRFTVGEEALIARIGNPVLLPKPSWL